MVLSALAIMPGLLLALLLQDLNRYRNSKLILFLSTWAQTPLLGTTPMLSPSNHSLFPTLGLTVPHIGGRGSSPISPSLKWSLEQLNTNYIRAYLPDKESRMKAVGGEPLTSWLKRDRDSVASRQITVENMPYLIFDRKCLTGSKGFTYEAGINL